MSEPYMSEKFEIAQGLDDLHRLCPPKRTLMVTAADGDTLPLPCADIWSTVGKYIDQRSSYVQGWSVAQQQAWNK